MQTNEDSNTEATNSFHIKLDDRKQQYGINDKDYSCSNGQCSSCIHQNNNDYLDNNIISAQMINIPQVKLTHEDNYLVRSTIRILF